MKKMWAGRTSGKTDQIADDFNSSIRFDQRMYPEDIAGSIAHAKMLAKQGIIPEEASAKIIAGLEGILADLNSGKLQNCTGRVCLRNTTARCSTIFLPTRCTELLS